MMDKLIPLKKYESEQAQKNKILKIKNWILELEKPVRELKEREVIIKKIF